MYAAVPFYKLAALRRAIEADLPPACTDSCCSGDRAAPAWLRAVKYGFVTLPRDLAWPLLAGVALASWLVTVTTARTGFRATDFLPRVMMLLMNFAKTTESNFGSGRIFRTGACLPLMEIQELG